MKISAPDKAAFNARRALAVEALAEQRLDALVVSAAPNVVYLTGFTGDNSIAVVTPAGTVLFTDPRFTYQAAGEVDCPVRICRGPLPAAAGALIRRRGLRRVGFERSRISYETYTRLEDSLPMGAALKPVAGLVETLRMVKSAEEIEAIRGAAQTTSQVFRDVLPRLRPGVTELEAAAEIDYRMRRRGASGPAFETIVASGARSALPHAHPTAKAFAPREPVLLDMGAVRDGYASDMTRTVFLGGAKAAARRIYRAVLEAQHAALAAVREGVTAAYVDRQARLALRARKLDRFFLHSTGHGLGLEIHESPRVGRKDKTRLRAGMVITIEPGVYVEGLGGVRIEDTVLVTGDGCEILTPASKELLYL